MKIVPKRLSVCTAGLLLALLQTTPMGQNLGTVTLPAELAKADAVVEDAMPSKPQKVTYCEGPVVDSNGNLYFSEQHTGIIWKVTPEGSTSIWQTLEPAYANGLDMLSNGNFAVCEKARITERDADGNLVRVITSGTSWGQGSNDLTLSSKGDMYFTAFNQHIWYHSADSSSHFDYNYRSPSNINFNGIELVEEQHRIYACQWGKNRVVTIPVREDGSLDTAQAKLFADVPGPDGITVDANYNVYIASNNSSTGAIFVYDSTGKELGKIAMTQDRNPSSNASNCVFGGPDNKTLYITGDSGAYKVQMNVAGRVKPENVTVRQEKITAASVQTPLHHSSLQLALEERRRVSGIFLRSSITSNNRQQLYTLQGRAVPPFSADKQASRNSRRVLQPR